MKKAPRPYIGMMFKCCRVYQRIYLNRNGDAFTGACPKCGKRVTVQVSAEGSSSRFWSAE